MVTPATGAARFRREIVRCRDAAQFERFGNKLADGFLNLVHLLLSVEEAARDGVVDQGLAIFFKLGDLVVGERHAGLLLLLEGLAFFYDKLVLLLGFFVGQEG